jgi:anaphase-promoting complex subunit 8
MLLALGEIYEKLDKKSNALKCYQKACNVGDIEGFAMLKLGNLYEKMGDQENAVNSYKNYVNDERSSSEKTSLITAFLYLANYYAEKKNYEEATFYAHKVLELDETKQEAKAILKRISSDRAKPEENEDDMTEAIMELEPEADIIQQNETSGEDMDMSLA